MRTQGPLLGQATCDCLQPGKHLLKMPFQDSQMLIRQAVCEIKDSYQAAGFVTR